MKICFVRIYRKREWNVVAVVRKIDYLKKIFLIGFCLEKNVNVFKVIVYFLVFF